MLLTLLAAAAAATGAAPLRLEDVAGGYHRHVTGAFMNGQEYGADDVLEVVPTSPAAAYVRTRLNFGNGHLCSVAAVFDLVGGELVYRDPARVEGEPPCVLRLRRVQGRVEFDDGRETCKTDCGARGAWGGSSFPLSSRRPITYLPRLKASEAYRTAVAEHAAPPPPPPRR